MAHKLGLKPHTPSERDFKLSSVYKAQTTLPSTFGAFGLDWQMLGNDEFGDCYEASSAHETMAEASTENRSPKFSKESVLGSYAEYLGLGSLKDLNEETDEGTDAREGAEYRREHGIKDVNGHGHKIGAYAFIEGKNVYEEIKSAVYDFEGVTVCVELPESAEEAFSEAERDGFQSMPVWDYKGGQIAGGHAISGIGVKDGQLIVVSWGQEVIMTEAFVEHYLQCVVVYVSGAVLNGEGKTINGFDAAALREKLAELKK